MSSPSSSARASTTRTGEGDPRQLDDGAPGGEQRLTVAKGAAEQESALEHHDHRLRQPARRGDLGDPPAEPVGRSVDPNDEYVRRREPQRLVAARDLEGDGGDRARVGVVRAFEVGGGRLEGVLQRLQRIRDAVEQRHHQLPVRDARGADRVLGEFLLTPGEEMVDRAERCARVRRDALQPGARVAVAPEQARRRVADPSSGVRPFRPCLLNACLLAGAIDYVDTGGTGPVLVLTHGLPMSPTQWRKVVPLLFRYRCVLPTLPLGGHRIPMRPDADLTQFGVARLLGEFLERLGLQDVTLVLNDWGGGQFLVTERFDGAERVGRLALVACEAFDNMPPGAAKLISVVAAVPGGVWLLLQLLRVRAIRDNRNAYGGMSVRGISEDVLTDWFRPARESWAIRRDFAKFATGTPRRKALLACSERLREFDRPALVVWATEDRLMPREHGPRLAALLPQGRLVEIAESSTLVPEDQPERLAEVLTEFLTETGAKPVQ